MIPRGHRGEQDGVVRILFVVELKDQSAGWNLEETRKQIELGLT